MESYIIIVDNHTFRKHFPKETKPALNEINTIRTIARNRKQSKTTLTTKLEKSYPNISEAVKQLGRKGLVKQTTPPIDYNKKRGNIEKFYKLTNEGLKVVIEDPLEKEEMKPLTSEQFWASFFETFEDASNKKELAGVSALYLRRILDVEPRYFLPKFFYDWHSNKNNWDYDPPEKKSTYHEFDETIIKTIGYGKPLTFDQLSRILNVKPKTIELYNKKKVNNFQHGINWLYFKGLLKKSEFGKKGKYDLTHLGVIELLFYLYRDSSIPLQNKEIIGEGSLYGVEKSKDSDAKNFVKTFNKIRIKYANLFHKIFNSENYQKLGIDSYEICALLMHLYKNEPYWRMADTLDRDDEWNEEYQVMQRFEKTRQEFYYRKWLEHLEKNDQVEDVTDKTKLEKSDLPLRSWFKQCLVLEASEYWLEHNFGENMFQYHLYSETIENRITFDFFSIYKAYCTGWDTVGMEKSKIKKWHDKESMVLLDFIKNFIGKKETMFEAVA